MRNFFLRVPFLVALIGRELEDCQANFESIFGYIYIFLFDTFRGIGIGNIEMYFVLHVPFIMALHFSSQGVDIGIIERNTSLPCSFSHGFDDRVVN